MERTNPSRADQLVQTPVSSVGSPPDPADDGYKWRVLIAVIFGTFMSILDNTVVNVALRTLQQVFQSDITHTQGVATYYALSLGIVIPIGAFLADRFGIKRVYVGSLLAFTAASMLCGLAPSLNALIAFRILQGLAGGALLPLGIAMLYGAFPLNQRGLALSYFGIPVLIAPALGPTLGGYLVEYFDWRLIFFINLPVGLLGAFVASRFLRERRSDTVRRFDLPGAVLSVIGFGSLLYAFSNAADQGWTSATVLGFLTVGIAGVAAFFLWELRTDHPLLDVRLYTKRTYLLASLLGWIAVIAFFGAGFLLPLYLQTLRGQTPFQAGLLLLPQALAAIVAVQFSGRLFDRIGPRYVITVGVVVLAISTWGLVSLTETTPLPFITALLVVRGFALSFVIQPTQATALSVVSRDQLTRASSLTNVMRNVFQSLGVAILGTLLQTQGKAPEASRAPDGFAAYTIAGYHAAYVLAFALSLIAICLAVFLPTNIQRKPVEARASATGAGVGAPAPAET